MIYLSNRLNQQERYGDLSQKMSSLLAEYGIKHQFLSNTRDIWLRDFMPIRTRNGRWISFRYKPSYLCGYPELRTDYRRDIAPGLDLPVVYSDINLDGGNVVFSPSRRRAIISERIFSENPKKEPEKLVRELEQLLEAEVILIPALKPEEDMTGHADGMVRFLEEHTVLGNQPIGDGELETKIKKVLLEHGIATMDFPYYETGEVNTDGIVSVEGSYLNYLETVSCIFLPQFGNVEKDRKAIAAAEKLFTKEVVPVPCKELAKEGGVLNCISWEM